MKIHEIMSKPVVTCHASDNLATAAQLMWDHDCGVVPIVGDAGEVSGMLTDRDICIATHMNGRAPHTIPIAEAMSKQVFSCRPDDTIDDAERLMSEKQVRRIPIVDDQNRPIGILSINDIARYTASSRKKDGFERALTQTLGSICQLRSSTQMLRKTHALSTMAQESPAMAPESPARM